MHQEPWPPQQPYQPPGPRRSWPRRHKMLTALIAAAWLLIALGALGAMAGGGKPAATGTPAPAAVRTVAAFTGSGQENTPRFTVSATWKLVYSFDCSAYGSAGNFQVFEDGGADFSGVSVNDLAMSKSASTWAYGDAGTHYLAVNSECSWKMKVVDEP